MSGDRRNSLVRRSFLRSFLLIAIGPFLCARPVKATITTAAEVRQLNPEAARKEQPVSIRAVVTYVNPQSGELFVQDRSAGIFVFIRNSTSEVVLRNGQLVKVDGVTAAGDFASSITKAHITVIGDAPMPRPVNLPFDRILTGEQDSQWGHLSGVVRSGREEAGILYLNAATPGGEFLIIMKDYPASWVTTLVDSKVSIDGVLAAVFNEQRQVTGVRIFVPSRRFLHLDEQAATSPYDLPEASALSVGAFRSKHDWSHRIRVRGVVTAVASRDLLYLSDGEGALPVNLWMTCGGQPGSLVDFVGFPGTVDGRPGLQSAICRVIAQGVAERPTELLARDIVPPQLAEDGSGLSIAKGTRNDLRLITVGGTVIQVAKGPLYQNLTLEAGDQTFSVSIPKSAWIEEGPETASQIKVTGVCLIAFDEYHRAQSFRVLARKSSDIVVVSSPSWLTLRHAVQIATGLGLLTMCFVVWIVVLRRHVATKTNELRTANERLRKLSVEDALTGAANRRHFDEVIEDEMTRCNSNSAPLSLVMIDIDHFKKVNDNFGHRRGDQYLIQVVGALRSVLVPMNDILIARYGGEEFAVLLPRTGQDRAAALAEEMRAWVQNMAISQQESLSGLASTISLGVATMTPGSTIDSAQFINSADSALYRAKRRGRNCVVISDRNISWRSTRTEAISRSLLSADVPAR